MIERALRMTLTAMALAVGACNGGADRSSGFNVLYGANCAGCHGVAGMGGVARGLADPIYLRIANDATIRRVTSAGVPGTAMPAFAKQSGGPLSEQQIEEIIRGIRSASTRVDIALDVDPPPYAAPTPGDPARGRAAYATFCSRCHGADGGGGQASSIVDASYLLLVSDQSLRTTVIAGRPDLGAPDWRGNLADRPLSSEEISDVVAWLSAQRPQRKMRHD